MQSVADQVDAKRGEDSEQVNDKQEACDVGSINPFRIVHTHSFELGGAENDEIKQLDSYVLDMSMEVRPLVNSADDKKNYVVLTKTCREFPDILFAVATMPSTVFPCLFTWAQWKEHYRGSLDREYPGYDQAIFLTNHILHTYGAFHRAISTFHEAESSGHPCKPGGPMLLGPKINKRVWSFVLLYFAKWFLQNFEEQIFRQHILEINVEDNKSCKFSLGIKCSKKKNIFKNDIYDIATTMPEIHREIYVLGNHGNVLKEIRIIYGEMNLIFVL